MEGLSYEPELILLDISLPFYNGFFLCNEIRKHTKAPITSLELLLQKEEEYEDMYYQWLTKR